MQKLKIMNENEIELFGLKAADGSEWKLIANGYGTNWIGVERINKKSPLGLRPKYIHDDLRRIEVESAIKRYYDADIIVPKEWYEELNELKFAK